MIYGMLMALSTAIYTMLASILMLQQTLINWMMSFSFAVLSLLCKPYFMVPLFIAGFFMVRRRWLRRGNRPPTWKSPGIKKSGSFRRNSENTSPRNTESSSVDDVGDTSQN